VIDALIDLDDAEKLASTSKVMQACASKADRTAQQHEDLQNAEGRHDREDLDESDH
jgi:hypothetical protein